MSEVCLEQKQKISIENFFIIEIYIRLSFQYVYRSKNKYYNRTTDMSWVRNRAKNSCLNSSLRIRTEDRVNKRKSFLWDLFAQAYRN